MYLHNIHGNIALCKMRIITRRQISLKGMAALMGKHLDIAGGAVEVANTKGRLESGSISQ